MEGALGDARAQARSVAQSAHRPWPVPDGPWVQGQTWRDLLFAHWPVLPPQLRAAVPAELPIDTFDGTAWLGITPFEVTGLHLRWTPPPPLLSRFLETNVRTYTTVDGRPGIWFLSLDASSRLAAIAARRSYRLPYFHAEISARRRGDTVDYRLRRRSSHVALEAEYRPTGAPVRPRPGTLEHFLTERYCLYTLDARQRLVRAEIHHAPWALQAAAAAFHTNTMTAPHGIELRAVAPLLHFSRRQDVVIWAPRRVR